MKLLSALLERLRRHARFARDFRAFLKRGNVLNLAVGVMIGGAFGKVVSSFVGDVLTPPIGLLIDEVSFAALRIPLGGPAAAPVSINYGAFLQSLLDFMVVAAVLFMVVRLTNRLRPAITEPAVPTKDQALLEEIRDELRRRPVHFVHPADTGAPFA